MESKTLLASALAMCMQALYCVKILHQQYGTSFNANLFVVLLKTQINHQSLLSLYPTIKFAL